jgi:hypothetical protein
LRHTASVLPSACAAARSARFTVFVRAAIDSGRPKRVSKTVAMTVAPQVRKSFDV